MPSINVVVPGSDCNTSLTGTVVALEMTTLVTPSMIVVLPAIGRAGSTATVVSPLTTTAVVPEMTVGAGICVAPIPSAIASAIASFSAEGAGL